MNNFIVIRGFSLAARIIVYVISIKGSLWFSFMRFDLKRQKIYRFCKVRAILFLVFFIITMIEVFLNRTPPLGNAYPKKPSPPYTDEQFFFAFVSYIIMIVTECFLIMFVVYLGMGLYYDSAGRVEQYLICRFCTWLAEIIILVVLSLTHNYLIGWYLVFLMIIILEFYAFIVVYSYYVDMTEYKENYKNNSKDPRLAEVTCCPCE